MKCDKLTASGGCTETADRAPCTARLCAAKNDARPAHMDTLKRLGDRQQRAEYLEGVERAEGRMAALVLRGEYIEWHERRHGPAMGGE